MRFLSSPILAFLIVYTLCYLPLCAQDTATTEIPVSSPPVILWEAGFQGGIANFFGDLVDTRVIQLDHSNAAYGGFLRYNFSPSLSVRASYLRGKLEASDADWETLAGRGLSFESTFNEFALVGQWNFKANNTYANESDFRMRIRPYVFAGIGLGLTDLSTDYSAVLEDPSQANLAAQDMANTNSTHIMVPIGIGLNADLSKELVFSVEIGLRPVFNDYLDGVSLLANPDQDDWYSATTAGLAYRWGSQKSDKDKDGIADYLDRCPDDPGTKETMGCPDKDEDGVVDHLDECPEEAGPDSAQGCPDGDQDGVPDYVDKCPRIPGSKGAAGCADSDGDGIPNSEDDCISIPGTAEFNGCRDTDGDGVPDPEDKCIYEKGEASSNGCPPPVDAKDPNLDSDGDSVVNSEDECPFLPGDPAFKGCPDSDKDGIADHKDRCPHEKGEADRKGCPPPVDTKDPNLDSDGDSVVNSEDECPFLPGDPAFKGCPDSDEDGIVDQEDHCPYEKGILEYNGCPIDSNAPVDTDGDGIVDKDDPCPRLAGDANGCPDTDSDGLADNLDNCPTVAGPASRQGCPIITTAVREVLTSAIDRVKFDQGSYKIQGSSYATLNNIAKLMQAYPTYHLKIEGHTDNQGDPAANKRLSEARAKSCANYLSEKAGIPLERITYIGHGGEKPRATNESTAGRRRNRRVEFSLFEPKN